MENNDNNFISAMDGLNTVTGIIDEDCMNAWKGTLSYDKENKFSSIRELRPEFIDKISKELDDYEFKNVAELVAFRKSVIENEMVRRSTESPFKNYKDRFFKIKFSKDVTNLKAAAMELSETYIFKIYDTFIAEDNKTYWRYTNPMNQKLNCSDLFGFTAYASVAGFIIDKEKKYRKFFNERSKNYILRDNNLFGIDESGRVFCTECVSMTNFYDNYSEKRLFFEPTYAEEITEQQYKFIESLLS